MFENILCRIVLFLTTLLFIVQADNSPCGNWESYKAEKCFKIFEHFGPYQDAIKECHNNESTLATIRYKEEQEFINEYLKKQKIADNVWIGIKYENNGYKWNDNSQVAYTNWAGGFPENKSDHCVQLDIEDNNFGKWSEALCAKKNLLLCQKPQTWSLSNLQKVLLDTIKNPVPIGFIYVQFPEEKPPIDIWPWMIWKDISNVYAGVFFRANGGQAIEFGKVQEENAPRLKEVDLVWNSDPAWAEVQKHKSPGGTNATLPIGDRSLWVRTGDSGSYSRYASFITSGGEIRPRNMAIKIWKRMS